MQDLGCGLRRKVRVAPVEHLCTLRACLVRVRVKTFLWILAYAEDLSGCSLW